jgi:hypothetical protein
MVSKMRISNKFLRRYVGFADYFFENLHLHSACNTAETRMLLQSRGHYLLMHFPPLTMPTPYLRAFAQLAPNARGS